MNKLQLYIYKSLRGFKSVRNFNPAENVQRHIHDFRHALECVNYNPTEKNLFYIISYIDSGSLFTIIRTIPDKALDHLATTIFVPNGLQITADEMASIVKRTTRMVSNPSVSDTDVAELHEMLSKEYPVDEHAPASVGSEGYEFAVCMYGGDTPNSLNDFYGPHLYQPDYLKYAGVILLDANLGLTHSATDLTDMKLADTVALLPPPTDPDGFTPYLYDHVFDRPFRVPLGGDVQVVWRRGGFEDKTQVVTVEKDRQEIEPTITSDSRKVISPSSFYVTSHTSKAIVNDVTITVNGIEIDEPRNFTLHDLKKADVVVTARGYAPFRATLDLAATTQALIQLQEQRKIYKFELPVKSSELGAPIHFEIHTKREISDSPIEGYSLLEDIREGQGRSNHLAYTGGAASGDWRKYAIGGASGLIIGLILGWLMIGSEKPAEPEQDDMITQLEQVAVSDNSKKQAEEKPAEPAPVPEAKPDQAPAKEAAGSVNTTPASEKALTYLDTHEVWTKEELEKFPELKGLFDDMNNFRLQIIIDTWGKKLAKSKRFAKVAHHTGEGMRKKVFKPEGTYCKEGDHSIKVQSYLNRVDPAKPATSSK